jgi:hypothetical protein
MYGVVLADELVVICVGGLGKDLGILQGHAVVIVGIDLITLLGTGGSDGREKLNALKIFLRVEGILAVINVAKTNERKAAVLLHLK